METREPELDLPLSNIPGQEEGSERMFGLLYIRAVGSRVMSDGQSDGRLVAVGYEPGGPRILSGLRAFIISHRTPTGYTLPVAPPWQGID